MSNQDGADRVFRAPTGVLAAAPLSNAVRIGHLLFISGQIGLGADGTIVKGGVGEQARVCLQSIKDALEDLGASMSDVVQTRIYLTDFAGYADFNTVYREFFTEPFPARATVGAPELALGAGIEIEAIACVTAGKEA